MAENIWFVDKKAREFFAETVNELQSIGWWIEGELSIERATITDDGSYYLETKVRRFVELGDK